MLFPKSYADRVQRLRVPGGFVLIASFLLLADPVWKSLAVGLLISVLGIALRAWAAGHLEKNTTLCDGGPYQYLRNPLYIGTLTTALGFVVASRRWEIGVVFAVLFLLIYLPVVELEEQHLRKLFPAYDAYANEVPRLIPRIPGRASDRRFQWATYKKNQEWKALLAFFIAAGFLAWKCLGAL